MKLSNQKLKLMYLAKILLENTNEEHTITVPQMIDELAKLGISAERVYTTIWSVCSYTDWIFVHGNPAPQTTT